MSTEIKITLTGKIYARATRLAQSANQVVGEKSDYYITLAQLEDILQNVPETRLDARRMCPPGSEPLA